MLFFRRSRKRLARICQDYNGKQFAKNNYDTKMKNNYEEIRKEEQDKIKSRCSYDNPHDEIFSSRPRPIFGGNGAVRGPLDLSKPEGDAPIRSALRRAESDRIGSPALFDDQSFQLRRDGRPSVSWSRVVERGGWTRPRQHMLRALVTTSTQIQLVETIGAGEWEAESCRKPVAVGAIDDSRIVNVYQADSPNAEALEPVVLNVENSRLSLDLEASRKGISGGAQRQSHRYETHFVAGHGEPGTVLRERASIGNADQCLSGFPAEPRQHGAAAKLCCKYKAGRKALIVRTSSLATSLEGHLS